MKELINKGPNFEDNIEIIDAELAKRRGKWRLTAICWMDFDDVSQIIRLHVWKKWHKYDASRPLKRWLNRVISSQIKNLIRNNYSNFSRPCLQCPAFEGGDLCSLFTKQSDECGILAVWIKKKKHAYYVKLPISINCEGMKDQCVAQEDNLPKITDKIELLNEQIKKILKPTEWKFYKLAYIDNKSDAEIAKAMNFKTSEKNRKAGYGMMANLKRTIIKKVKIYLGSGKFDI